MISRSTGLNACRGLLAGLAALALGATATIAQERTMVVLDASGSMWGQIDGKPKLQIARETLREVLKDMPSEVELGLMAYGHREKGNCGDIELIVPPAKGTAGLISDKVDKLKFIGKTPLSEAVKRAAEVVRYTEDKATVVLVTDGIETCGVDVCAMGKQLEEQGVDFTAHVVGFGLSRAQGKQVACLAENTGGTYFSASDAFELVTALNETVVVQPPTFTFRAVDQEGTEVTGIPLNWTIQGKDAVSVNGQSGISRELSPGSYQVIVSGPDISGGAEFQIAEKATDRTITVPVERVIISATVDAQASVPAGAVFEVSWTGPDAQGDYIAITKKGSADREWEAYAYTNQGSPAKITAPDGVGDYEVRYVIGENRKVVASRPITLTPVSAKLNGPAEIAAGAEFSVEWTGPSNKADYITVVQQGSADGKFNSYVYTEKGSPVTLTAPDGIGAFELRYVFGQSKRTVASVPIILTPISAKLQGPAEAASGSQFEVEWTGPANKGDYVTIVEKGAGEGKFNSYVYTDKGSPVKLTAPDKIGAYELRYVFGQSKRTVASTPITLTTVSAKLQGPAEIAAGAPFEVQWTGPNNKSDYITIVEKGSPQGKYTNYAYTSNGSPAKLTAPDGVGEYELRYVVGQSKRTLAAVPISLTAVAATVKGPAETPAGSSIVVEWTGPSNKSDYVTIVEKGAPQGTYTNYAYTKNGSPSKLTVPDGVGDYEIRYVVGQSKRTLASAPVTLTPIEGSVKVENTPVAGGRIVVSWTGPGYPRDYITIVEKGTPDGQFTSYAYTKSGSPAEFNVPKALGKFEVRYVLGASKRTLARVPVDLIPATASLQLNAASVSTGAVLEVTWTGPANRGDYIEIVPEGAPANAGSINKANAAQGSPLSMYAPGSPGAYEVRYRMRSTGEVLGTTKLTVQ